MDTSSHPDIVVVGAGPAGLMAAAAAAGAGARVAVLERQASPGRKLLASGGGRCNVTAALPAHAMAARYEQRRFVGPALRAFGPDALRQFLDEEGVATVELDGACVFPASQRAGDVLAALLAAGRRAGAELRCGRQAPRLLFDGGRVAGVETEAGERIACRAAILAAGGPAYPSLGGTDAGYALARQAGHAIVPPVPALVALRTADEWPTRCAGVTLADCEVRLDGAPGERAAARGALLFTHRGVSGPAVLDLSARVARRLLSGAPALLRANLLPGADPAGWPAQFEAWRRERGRKAVRNLLAERLPQSLCAELAALAGAGDACAAALTREARERLAALLTGLPLPIATTEGLGAAMATAGGVSCAEVAAGTLESRLAPGLYFAGELLDVDGPCGGFNLQWAFSSGRLAGAAAAAAAAGSRP